MADYYGKLLIEPRTLDHQAGQFKAAIALVQQSLKQHKIKDVIVVVERTGSLQEELNKAVEIVGTIVKTTMSGNYQIVSNREYRNAWIMRGVAIAAFLAMGGMIVWAATSIDLGENGVNWTTVAFRVSLGIAFLIPGLYCAH